MNRRTFIATTGLALHAPLLPLAAEDSVLREIVFGSCIDRTEHPMLDRTLMLPMDLFLFLGDNIYADTMDMAVMRQKYDALKRSHFYRGILDKAPFLATWDDHDYGANDGGADYVMRREAQKEFFDWLDVPADSPKRSKEGVYHAAVYGPVGRRVQVTMLDTRYFRSPLKRGSLGLEPSGGKSVPETDPEATVLGAAQWEWLEAELHKPAELRLIGTSIQFVPSAHGGESWANFPLERRRLIDLIGKTKASGVLFLSGDRHWCELSRMDGPLGYALYDITSSSLTQEHPRGTPTPNSHRYLPKTYHHPNVGRLSIDWDATDPVLVMQIIDVAGVTQIEHQLTLGQLQAV